MHKVLENSIIDPPRFLAAMYSYVLKQPDMAILCTSLINCQQAGFTLDLRLEITMQRYSVDLQNFYNFTQSVAMSTIVLRCIKNSMCNKAGGICISFFFNMNSFFQISKLSKYFLLIDGFVDYISSKKQWVHIRNFNFIPNDNA